MLTHDDLVLCGGTVSRASLPERITAAAKAGFKGLSLFYDDYARARADGLSDADLRSQLEDCDIRLAELDPLMDWLPGAESSQDTRDEHANFFSGSEDRFYALADTFGARSLNAIVVAESMPEIAVVADAFGRLCDRAAAHDLIVHLEFLPWTPVPDLRVAFEIVQLADRPNGGIMFDTWHHFRSGLDNEELSRIPGERILGIQINDAPAQAEENLVSETLSRRLLPGEGDIDLVDILRRLREIGTPAPIGVEIFSEKLAERPAGEIAQLCADAARRVLERV